MRVLLCAQLMQLRILPDDIIVSGTDGLFDNVFAEEVASLVTFARKRGDSPALAATVLASYTQMKAAETTHMSPFAYAAQVRDPAGGHALLLRATLARQPTAVRSAAAFLGCPRLQCIVCSAQLVV